MCDKYNRPAEKRGKALKGFFLWAPRGLEWQCRYKDKNEAQGEVRRGTTNTDSTDGLPLHDGAAKLIEPAVATIRDRLARTRDAA
jgi:hypothetical protein